MSFVALFALIIGVGMAGYWMFACLTGTVPELKSEPWRIGFHIAAEMLTSCTLFVSGLAICLDLTWAHTGFYLASGMLLYTALASPGYFVQQRQYVWTIIFAAIILLDVAALFTL